MCFRNLAFLIITLLLISCVDKTSSDTTDNGGEQELELINVFDVAVSDPSGLAIDTDGVHLWTVSDDPGKGMYKITKQGIVVKHAPFNSDDLEGIVVDPTNNTLWVVEERLREVLNVSREGVVLSRTKLEIEANRPNDGLEGITIHPETLDFYVLNEKNPRLLIRLNRELEIQETVPMDYDGIFFMGDVAGITYDEVEDVLWIISDESRKIVVIDMEYNPIRMYRTGIVKGEGIAVDPHNRRLYAVCDRESLLYVFGY